MTCYLTGIFLRKYRSDKLYNEGKKNKAIGSVKQTAQGKLPGQLSEDYLQAVIDSLEDELIVIDLDYRIVQANRAVLRRHGKSIEEIIGRHCYEISHSSLSMCCPPHDDCPVARACESGKAARTTHRHVYNNGGRQKQRYVEVVASPILNKEGTVVYVVEVLRDVTEAREMELKIAEAHRDLLTLNDITNVVSQSLDMETVLSNALDRTLKVLKAEGGGILLHEVDAKSLRYRVHRGLSEKFVCEVTENQDAGITAQVMRSLKPVFINDVRGVHGIPGSDALRAEGLRSFASLPLVLKGKLLGALNIAGRETRRFSDQEK